MADGRHLWDIYNKQVYLSHFSTGLHQDWCPKFKMRPPSWIWIFGHISIANEAICVKISKKWILATWRFLRGPKITVWAVVQVRLVLVILTLVITFVNNNLLFVLRRIKPSLYWSNRRLQASDASRLWWGVLDSIAKTSDSDPTAKSHDASQTTTPVSTLIGRHWLTSRRRDVPKW